MAHSRQRHCRPRLHRLLPPKPAQDQRYRVRQLPARPRPGCPLDPPGQRCNSPLMPGRRFRGADLVGPGGHRGVHIFSRPQVIPVHHSPPHKGSTKNTRQTPPRPTRPRASGTYLQRPSVGTAWRWWRRAGLLLGRSASGQVVGTRCVPVRSRSLEVAPAQRRAPPVPSPRVIESSAVGGAQRAGCVWGGRRLSPASQVRLLGTQPGPELRARTCRLAPAASGEETQAERPQPVSLNLKYFYY